MYMWYSVVVWKVELEPIREWLQTLDKPSKEQVAAAIMLLQREGPDLKRPLVGKIVTSRYRNMKELRPGSAGRSEIRILFVFDPQRSAILLVGGDKAGKWDKWYRKAIPQAERIYEQWIRQSEKG